jgi:hypothetical protein
MLKKARNERPLASGVHYEGKLAEPIHKPFFEVVFGREAEDFIREARTLKIPLLFELYRIDERSPTAWEKLAWALACDHVPGMQEAIFKLRHKRGRKPSWKSGLGLKLLREVEALREEKKIGIKAALEELRRDKTKEWNRYSSDTLSARYREAARAEKGLLESPTAAFFDLVSGKISRDDLQRRLEEKFKISLDELRRKLNNQGPQRQN